MIRYLVLTTTIFYNMFNEGHRAGDSKQLVMDTVYWYQVNNICADPKEASLNLDNPILSVYGRTTIPLCNGNTYCCALGYAADDIDPHTSRLRKKVHPSFVRYHD